MYQISAFTKMATAVVGVLVGSVGVVNVEQPVVQVLVIVTASVQARVRPIEVPVIARKPHSLHRRPRFLFLRINVSCDLLLKGQTPSNSPLREFKETTAAVGALVGSAGAVNEEQPVAQALVIVTASAQARVRPTEAPAIARICLIASV